MAWKNYSNTKLYFPWELRDAVAECFGQLPEMREAMERLREEITSKPSLTVYKYNT